MMAAGLGLLRLSPRDFWSMTPRELFWALRPPVAANCGQTPGREELQAMMLRFPDKLPNGG